jgi:hypothetical protein
MLGLWKNGKIWSEPWGITSMRKTVLAAHLVATALTLVAINTQSANADDNIVTLVCDSDTSPISIQINYAGSSITYLATNYSVRARFSASTIDWTYDGVTPPISYSLNRYTLVLTTSSPAQYPSSKDYGCRESERKV